VWPILISGPVVTTPLQAQPQLLHLALLAYSMRRLLMVGAQPNMQQHI
jgi:hypothetical protein